MSPRYGRPDVAPLVAALQSCPPVLWISLVLVWAGTGSTVPVVVVFATHVQSNTALEQIEKRGLEVAKSLATAATVPPRRAAVQAGRENSNLRLPDPAETAIYRPPR